LVYRALELMNAVSEDAEEAIHDSMPFFRPQLRREFHRPLHVGKENSYLLTLAFQRASRGEDLLGEVSRWVQARAPPSNVRGLRERLPALAAKLYAARVFKAAGWATHRWSRGRQHRRPLRFRDSSIRVPGRFAIHRRTSEGCASLRVARGHVNRC